MKDGTGCTRFILNAKLIAVSDLPKMEHFGDQHKQRPKQKNEYVISVSVQDS